MSTSHPTPYNGEPYYCLTCGAGFEEFGACEETECHLEPAAHAQARKAEHDAEAKAKKVPFDAGGMGVFMVENESNIDDETLGKSFGALVHDLVAAGVTTPATASAYIKKVMAKGGIDVDAVLKTLNAPSPPVYDSNHAYNVNDVMTHGGKTYMCHVAGTGLTAAFKAPGEEPTTFFFNSPNTSMSMVADPTPCPDRAYYRLDGYDFIGVYDVEEWALWMDEARAKGLLCIGHTTLLGPYKDHAIVATQFIGSCPLYKIGDVLPLVFETTASFTDCATTLFGKPLTALTWKYLSYAEAQAGHAKAVEAVEELFAKVAPLSTDTLLLLKQGMP